MRRRFFNWAQLISVMLAALLLLPPVLGDEQSEKRIELAKTFVSQMGAGDFEKAVQPFDETMEKGDAR